jgi:hypothetical protein
MASYLKLALAVSAVCLLAIAGCGVYTFTGSSLPGNLKTVDIPLFLNESLQPGVAEEITEALNTKVQGANLLRIVSSGGDATISGRVVSYANQVYTYTTSKPREVDASEYAVRVTIEVLFNDNKTNQPLYKGRVVGEGVYSTKTEIEETGRAKAIKDAVEQIVQNSVQGW